MKKLFYPVIGCGLFLGGIYTGAQLSAWPFGAAKDLRATYELIRAKHTTTDASDDELYYGAVRGMVDALNDPFSAFLDPKTAAMQRQQMSGNFVGIGAEVGFKDEHFTVITPIEGSPAEKAGIRPGDVIVSVDGVPTAGKTVMENVARIRGEKGTTVTLHIQRAGVPDAFDVLIVRNKVDSPSVKWHTVTENGKTVMVVAVSGFHDDTGELFTKAVAETKRVGATGFVLDLRNDGGGRLDMAGAVVCQWVRDVPFVVVEPKGEKEQPEMCGKGIAPLGDIPTAILVNKGSASASEVTTGALQDYGKARVFGEQSFGKGCGQSVIDFADGAQLELVTFLWKTPKGRHIHKVGITPDEVVKGDPDEIKKGNDAQLARALQYVETGR